MAENNIKHKVKQLRWPSGMHKVKQHKVTQKQHKVKQLRWPSGVERLSLELKTLV